MSKPNMILYKKEWKRLLSGTYWDCRWVIKYENGQVCFDFSAILGAEEYSSLWMKRTFEIPEPELAVAINDALTEKTAYLDDKERHRKFVLKESTDGVTITFFCSVYRDGSGHDAEEDIPMVIIRAMGMR